MSSARIPEEIIAEIKARLDIVDVIANEVKLNANGKGLCPYHNETNPSFSVNREGQYFRL
jgi:DNA primase